MQSVRLIPERIEMVSHGFRFTLQRVSFFWLTLGPPRDLTRLATKGYRNLLFPWGLKDKREVPWRLGFSKAFQWRWPTVFSVPIRPTSTKQ